MKTAAELYRTIGLGSLPHHNVDSALQFALRLDIPFLPQMPIRNPNEFMIHQTLEGIPGLVGDKDGLIEIDVAEWNRGKDALSAQLDTAFSQAKIKKDAFEAFEPTPDFYGSWPAFLWELRERKIPLAKIQLAGPMTCQWAIRYKKGENLPVDQQTVLRSQVFQIFLARALSMTRKMQEIGVQPMLFLDEPGLFVFDRSSPQHLLAIQELRLTLQTLRKEGVIVGLHCCSNTDWDTILSLDLHYLSFDFWLSSDLIFASSKLESFFERGGQACFGVIPIMDGRPRRDVETAVSDFLNKIESSKLGKNRTKFLETSFYSPVCGLALQKTEDAEQILHELHEFQRIIQERVGHL